MNDKDFKIHNGKVDCNPEDVGFDKKQLDYLNSMYKEFINKDDLTCASYALSKDGKTFACNSMGALSAIEDKGDLQPDSIRGVASITKVFTATAIMLLIEDGKLLLTTAISSIIKEFDTDIHSGITIQHLLTHTSGLSSDPGAYLEPYPFGWWNNESKKINWIKKIIAGPLAHDVGTVWGYCSGGFCLLGEVIARVSGMSYEDYLAKKIFEPLGMDRSFFQIPSKLKDQVCIVDKDDLEDLDYKNDVKDHIPPAGGGLYSTLPDLLKFGNMMLNKGNYNGKQIISPKTVEFMTRNQLDEVPSYNWGNHDRAVTQGIAWRICSDNLVSVGTYKHEGAGASGFYIDPVENFVAVYFVPSKKGWTSEAVFGTLGVVWAGIK